MKKLLFVFISGVFCCCQKPASDKNFIDQLIDLTIQSSTGEEVQFPHLYNNLARAISDDQDEQIILAEKLKARGFVAINWGRGNFPPLSPRIITVELKKKDCICLITKTYYLTIEDSVYQMVESISCSKIVEKKH